MMLLTPDTASLTDAALALNHRAAIVELDWPTTGTGLHDALIAARDSHQALVINCPDQDAAAGHLPALALLAERTNTDLSVVMHPTAAGVQIRAVSPRPRRRPWWRVGALGLTR